jgi:hypothetical protein
MSTPGFQQIHGAGDEGALARAAHRHDHVRSVVGPAHALEGVVVLGRPWPVLPTPAHVEVVHVLGHAVGMDLAGAEDDDLLLRPAVLAQELEQVCAHFGRAQFDEQFVVEVLAGVFALVRSASVSGLPVLMSLGTPGFEDSSLVKMALSMLALRLTISQAAR